MLPALYQRSGDQALTEQMEAELQSVNISQWFYEWAFEQIKKKNVAAGDDLAVKRRLLTKELQDIRHREAVLGDKLLAGTVTDEDYREQKTRLVENRTRVECQITRNEECEASFLTRLRSTFEFARHAPEAYSRASKEEKRAILAGLGEAFTMRDRKLNVSLQKPLQPISEAVSSEAQVSARLEPAKTRSGRPPRAFFDAMIPVWSAALNKVRGSLLRNSQSQIMC